MEKTIHPRKVPYLLVSDNKGNLFEDETKELVGRTGNDFVQLKPTDFIEMPDGSEFFTLPDRNPVFFNKEKNKFDILENKNAVAAFVAPAHTQLYLSAYKKRDKAVILPLYNYTAVGWLDDKFWVAATRVDKSKRQDCDQFHQEIIIRNAKDALKKNPSNRLLKHLSHCALVYLCPAARNYFMGRWEMPVPTSPSCNARCLGCISYQPKQNCVTSPQIRLNFIPSVAEIVELTVKHLEEAPLPVASFGQGCEGEPLMVWEVIRDSIKEIRRQTKKGVININTNASNPKAIEELCNAGLDSIRISMNSVIEEDYNKYYNPVNYSYSDVLKSLEISTGSKIWTSLNYLTFPGLNDRRSEVDELKNIIKTKGLSMIQWRNFGIDPDWFFEKTQIANPNDSIGIKNMMNEIKSESPSITYGYFNPDIATIEKARGR